MQVRKLVAIAGALALVFPAASAARSTNVSSSFAGYGQNNNTSSSSLNVTATLVVPKVKCGKKDTGFTPNVGLSTAFSSAGVFVGCLRGKERAWPSLSVNGADTSSRSAAVKAGDTIVLTVSENAAKTTVTVADMTQKFKKQRTGTGSTISDPWIGENTWKNLPLPAFGTLKFTDGLVNAKPFGTWSGGVTKWEMVTTSGTIRAGAFTSGGTAFATHYTHP